MKEKKYQVPSAKNQVPRNSDFLVPGTWYAVLFNQRGVSMVELMITVVIALIVVFATAVPFFAERSFLVQGERQAEAQRDAQFAMQAIARIGRQSTGVAITTPAANHQRITFTQPCGTIIFDGGAGFNGGQLQRNNQCPGQTDLLIDAGRSRVATFTAAAVSANVINFQIDVIHDNQRNELLNTQIFVRNA